jgi:hypothetical protein
VTDFKPDPAKARAAYDTELARLAALRREISVLEDQVDERMRAAHDAERKLNVWAPYLDPQPEGSINDQLWRLPEDVEKAVRAQLEDSDG